MNSSVLQLIHALRDPDASSALLPIALTLCVLVILALLGLYLLAKGARTQVKATRFSLKTMLMRWKASRVKPTVAKVATAAPAPTPRALPKTDPIEVDRLKHALVLLHAQHTKILIRCSGLESQLKEVEQKYLDVKATSGVSNARVEELQKHVADLEKVLNEINGEVRQFSKPKWSLGQKISALLAKLTLPKKNESRKDEPENNLLTLLVGEEKEIPDPSATHLSAEPASFSDAEKS